MTTTRYRFYRRTCLNRPHHVCTEFADALDAEIERMKTEVARPTPVVPCE